MGMGLSLSHLPSSNGVENEEKLWKEKMGEHYFLGREVTAAAGVNFASLNN